jgi:hypothetical protein
MKRLLVALMFTSQTAFGALITHTDYTGGSVITAAGQNTNENAIVNEINGNLSAANLATGSVETTEILDGTIGFIDLSSVVSSSFTALQNPFTYRRPNLKWQSVVLVDVENNTSTANQTCIIFPDSERRCVTEDVASQNRYRRFDITAAASFTTGTMDSGLRSGISEANNTRYAIYAVKCTAAAETANFVLAGDTTFPTQGNAATLNSRYGTSGYVFLGYVWNGNGLSGNGDIVSFVQAGPTMTFTNTATGNIGDGAGVLVAGTAAAATLTFTYAAGSSSVQIPDTITHINWGVHFETVAGNVIAKNSGGNRMFINQNANSTLFVGSYWSAATDGVALSNGPASSEAQDIFVRGYVDGALTGSLAPLF